MQREMRGYKSQLETLTMQIGRSPNYRAPRTANADTICDRCGGPHHHSLCTRDEPVGPRCYNCQSPDHLARACPLNRNGTFQGQNYNWLGSYRQDRPRMDGKPNYDRRQRPNQFGERNQDNDYRPRPGPSSPNNQPRRQPLN
jgi:hypothetical protein